ncbi:MAG: T9SS type A sorting domain-containing protein [Chitinophagales bacterium]
MLYPNPVAQYLNISLKNVLGADLITLSIYDMQGNFIFTAPLSPNAENKFRIKTLSGISPGTYLVQIQSGNLHWDGAIVIQDK